MKHAVFHSARLNIVLHDIVAKESECASKYTVTRAFATEVCDRLLREAEHGTYFQQLGIYVDDGYSSVLSLPLEQLCRQCDVAVAIVTSWLGRDGFLSHSQLVEVARLGVRILPHGVSHVALACMDDQGKRVLPTPNGEELRIDGFGKEIQLNSRSVRYQLEESRESLKNVAQNIDEFVLPYGLYNKQTIEINQRGKYYTRLANCESFLDPGTQQLRPRVVITSCQAAHGTFRELCNLPVMLPGHVPEFLGGADEDGS